MVMVMGEVPDPVQTSGLVVVMNVGSPPDEDADALTVSVFQGTSFWGIQAQGLRLVSEH